MGLGFASKGTPILLLDVAGGTTAPGSRELKLPLVSQIMASTRQKEDAAVHRTRNRGDVGQASPLAAADRIMATQSVRPYLPSKYLIMVASSILLVC